MGRNVVWEHFISGCHTETGKGLIPPVISWACWQPKSAVTMRIRWIWRQSGPRVSLRTHRCLRSYRANRRPWYLCVLRMIPLSWHKCYTAPPNDSARWREASSTEGSRDNQYYSTSTTIFTTVLQADYALPANAWSTEGETPNYALPVSACVAAPAVPIPTTVPAAGDEDTTFPTRPWSSGELNVKQGIWWYMEIRAVTISQKNNRLSRTKRSR